MKAAFFGGDTQPPSSSAPMQFNENSGDHIPVLTASVVMPTPSPEPDIEGYLECVGNEFFGLVSFDMGFDFDRNEPFAEEIYACRDRLLTLDERYCDDAAEALELAAARASHEYGFEPEDIELEGERPSWQLASAVCWACGEEGVAKLLRSACGLELVMEEGVLKAELSVGDFDEIADEMTGEERFTADFIYSYYLTVYDDEFVEKDYIMPGVSKNYISKLSYPLEYMFFYDTWYGPRQYSTRYHLGMDIHARCDAEIYSCTDGTVIMQGFDETAGYYVVIEDSKGYEYHYYHMVRASDFLSVGDEVQSGQHIGNVGCTGNSDAYHLHLSIITPDHVHLNPYNVMCALRDIKEG